MNIDKLQTYLQNNNLDAAYISNPITIAYFTGYEMDPHERIFALLAFKDAEPFIFAPALNVEEAKASAWSGDVFVYLDHENQWKIIADLAAKRTNALDSWAIEKEHLSVSRLQALQTALPNASFAQDISPFIAQLRMIKTPAEIKHLQAAGAECDFAFKVAFETLKQGITERAVASQIDYQLQVQRGTMQTSFETIVQAGKNAANPHLGPTMTTIEPNELVLFDLGFMKEGYASDSSRTVAFGEPSAKEKEIYEVNREAQQAAVEAAKPGMTASELDAVARDIITKAGYGEYFIHRLGHGIGKVVHEAPAIMQGNDLVLQPGMCFSIEPGIYIPGLAGVRIEDCGVVTDHGFEVFTHTSKDLKIIPAH
ncbi:MAG: Xaa-Pro peptidase family protein [Lactobacillus sp.]|jgi:Xaa-Pro dipeptidase|nr:Xaa-Pro peptidase family protein [Lactobacillus sp.]